MLQNVKSWIRHQEFLFPIQPSDLSIEDQNSLFPCSSPPDRPQNRGAEAEGDARRMRLQGAVVLGEALGHVCKGMGKRENCRPASEHLCNNAKVILLAMGSNLIALASNLMAMDSNLTAMASNLIAMASNLVAYIM